MKTVIHLAKTKVVKAPHQPRLDVVVLMRVFPHDCSNNATNVLSLTNEVLTLTNEKQA